MAARTILLSEKRIELTRWVGIAWQQFHEQYKATIVTTFRQLGISLNPNGTEDHELKIKR